MHAANGLVAIHSVGGFHRDIKPENLLLSRTPNGESIVKVADFGLARRPNTVVAPMTASAGGTPGYMAPELSRPGATYSAACDIYSLGVVGIELITAYCSPEALMAIAAPEDFKILLKRMASIWPIVRPSLADVIIELARIIKSTSPSPPPPAMPPASPPPTQSDGGGLLGALLIAGVFIAAGALAAGNKPEYDPTVDRYRGRDGRFKRR
ncbi:MAG: protein kinase [Polyangiaceae bacterium]|nr:protein kinase [Polyangiaceae bacterium]